MSDQAVKKRTTAADIAKSLGISRATVGFVLNDTPGQTISPRTRERVLSEAERLGYRPHLAARALASGQSKIILLLLPDWPIEYNLRTHLDEASLALDEAGYSLVTMTPHPSGQARPLWETLQPDLVMGMVPFTSEQAESIGRIGVPFIDPGEAPEDSSDVEFSSGPAMQVRHLVEAGHRKIVFATTGDERLRELASDREETARRAAEESATSLEVVRVDESNVANLVSAWHRAGITAVAAYNDDIAALIVGACLRAGLAVPSELAVIGHDDAPIARTMVPSLSTIHVDTVGLGRYFAALALHAVDGAPMPMESPVIRNQLVRRESA
jgi:DNA-binding LacI/PurR family transcriptional regulator